MTPEEAKSALFVVKTLAEAIREAGEIPSGHLYATVMDKLTLDQYESAIGVLKRTGLVTDNDHLLKWQEPKGGKGR